MTEKRQVSSSGDDLVRAQPAFLADAMLGSLARWLRVLGFDVHYDSELDDAELVERALAEDRLILTRDTRLIQRRKARRHLLIRSDAVAEQVRQVVAELHLEVDPQRAFGRCLRCNEPLAELPADRARRHVPPHVARTQDRFSRCPICRRIYWPATHVERMRNRLRELGLGDIPQATSPSPDRG